MSKRKWRSISNKPHRLLIALVGIASLMGVSYASFSDQLAISNSITVELPDKPDEPPADNKVSGNIMIHNGYIKAGGTGCIHEDEGVDVDKNGICKYKGKNPSVSKCDYYFNGKGITVREPIYIPETITGGIKSVTGTATFVIRSKNNKNLSQTVESNISDVGAIHFVKENGTIIVPKEGNNLPDRDLTGGNTYVIELNIANWQTPVGPSDATLDTQFNGISYSNLEVEATIDYKITFNDDSHLCSDNGEKRIHKDSGCTKMVIRHQYLTVSESEERYPRSMQGSAASGIYIAPPGISFLPEFPAPPDINGTPTPDFNLPTILPEVPVPPDMDATEAPDINLPTTVPDVTNPSDLHKPSVLPDAPVLPEGNGTATPEVPVLPEGNTSETPGASVPPESSTEATPNVPAPPESSTEATPDVEVPTTTPEAQEPPASSSSQTPDLDMPTTMPDVTLPPSQGEESLPESPQENLISD